MKLKIRRRHWIGTPTFTGPIEVIDGWLAIDTETTGLDPWGTLGVDRTNAPARPFMATVTNADGESTLVRWLVDAFSREVKLCGTPGEEWLRTVLADESIDKVGYNTEYDVTMLELLGFEVKGQLWDVMQMVHALSPDEMSFKLKPICKKFIGIQDDDEKAVTASAGKFRAKVRAARKRIEEGKTKDGDADLAAIKIFEPFIDPYSEKQTTDKNAAKADMWLADEATCNEYGTKDSFRTAVLYEHCRSGLDANMERGGELWEIFRQEQKLAKVIHSMQHRGIRVEEEKVEELGDFYWKLMEAHRESAVSLAKTEDFNPDSTQSLRQELIVARGMKPVGWCINKKTKRPTRCEVCKGEGCLTCDGTGHNPKMDNDFLAHYGIERKSDEDLRPKDQMCWDLMHMKAAKAMLGFIKSYQRFGAIEPSGTIIHPNYKQVGPVTGRMAAENPNLQNVADDESGKKKCTVPYRPRECFIPRKDHIFYVPDYSQIEIWMLALRAKATALLKILMLGGDTHGRIASMVWKGQFDLDAALKAKKQDPDSLHKDDRDNLKIYVNRRKRSKNLQFCKVYGGGPAKIAYMIGGGCTIDEAKRFNHEYNMALPEVPRFMEQKIREAREKGVIVNAFGREYTIDPNRAYVATNYDLQGSAADLIKRAMIRVENKLQEETDGKAQLLLQIHDELLIEVHNSVHSEGLMKSVAWEMQSDHLLLGCPVPFPVGFKIAEERWSKAKEIKL